MIKILFICHGSTAGSRYLAVLVGAEGQSAALEKEGDYGFTTSREQRLKYKNRKLGDLLILARLKYMNIQEKCCIFDIDN